MAQVVKCDQCGKVDTPSNMKQATLRIGVDSSDRYTSDKGTASGDFCSQECVKLYIYAKLNDLWYNSKYV